MNQKGLYDPIYKLTIESAGNTLGFLLSLPEKDKTHVTKNNMLSRVKVALAGRAAEEVFFGADNVSSGAYSDFRNATGIAHNMVRRFGMSKHGILLMEGEDYTNSSLISEKMKETLYYEAKEIIDANYNEVLDILRKNTHIMHRLAYYLMLYKTLYGKDIEAIIEENYSFVGTPSSINILNNNLGLSENYKIQL